MSDATTLNEYVPTAEELEQHFSALGDSVAVIDELVANGPRSGQTQEEYEAAIARNAEHLELMVEKSFIKGDGRSLKSFKDAATKGRGALPAKAAAAASK